VSYEKYYIILEIMLSGLSCEEQNDNFTMQIHSKIYVCVNTERLISYSILYNKKEKKNKERNNGLPSNIFLLPC
jgi:hypothetical protein